MTSPVDGSGRSGSGVPEADGAPTPAGHGGAGRDDPGRGPRITRRRALQLIGGAGVAGWLTVHEQWARGLVGDAVLRPAAALLSGPAAGVSAPSFTAQVTRAQDMLALTFDFYNMALDTSTTPPQVAVVDPTSPAYLVVVFPPQHVGEYALAYPVPPPPAGWPPDPPYPGVLTNESWLAFEVGAPIPFTLAHLLTWTSLTPSLAPVAVPDAGSVPSPPTATQTSLEVPWNLVLSPDPKGTWHHSTAPNAHGGITELWQTRLGKGGQEPPAVHPAVRAVWTPGYGSTLPSDPFTMSLTPQNRSDLVTLTSGGIAPTGAPIPGVPIPADLLMLTALGAVVDLDGSWTASPGLSLIGWIHRTSPGRDSYVRTVTLGYLLPTGHRAVKIVITDREFQVDASGNTVAVLVQRTFVEVVQPTLTYAGNPDEPDGGRQNPLRTIAVTTRATPPLDTDTTADPQIAFGSFDPAHVMWVRSAGQDVPFTHVATDVEGRKATFATGAVWVDAAVVSPQLVTALVATWENTGITDPARRTPSLGGQLLAFAKPLATGPGKTAKHADSYELGAAVSLDTTRAPGWFPVMDQATIRLPEAEALTGGSPLGGTPVVYDPDYLASGFAAGFPEVYLDVVGGGPALAFPGKNTGGAASPNFHLGGVTRDSGPVGGNPHNLRSGTFDPSDFFPTGNGALLLGAIELADIILGFVTNGSGAKGQAPKIHAAPAYPNNDKAKPPTAIDTTLDWTPKVKGDPLGFFVPKSGSKLAIHAHIHTPFANASDTSFRVHVSLTKFELQLFGSAGACIQVTFSSVTFKFGTGAKAVVKPKIDSVTFVGPLSFIQDLEQLLASLGGPSIAVSGGGITADYALPLPSISVGVFAIQNLKIDAGLTIPFDGQPVRARFGLCTRDDPFVMTIYFFQGGGFFGVALGADGIEMLEVSLEFGAGVSLDFGVASGSVSIMAGIYFQLKTVPTSTVELTGFLKADGSLEVLGILTVSVELYLGFTYLSPGKAYGEASLTLSVKFLCFSASVTVTYQKQIAGSANDPTFAQAISSADWATYCGAFA